MLAIERGTVLLGEQVKHEPSLVQLELLHSTRTRDVRTLGCSVLSRVFFIRSSSCAMSPSRSHRALRTDASCDGFMYIPHPFQLPFSRASEMFAYTPLVRSITNPLSSNTALLGLNWRQIRGGLAGFC